MPCDSITLLESSNLPHVHSVEVGLSANPVDAGASRIRVEGVRVKSWVLYDLQGRLIHKEEHKFGNTSIDIPGNLQTGLYFVELRSDKARYVKPLMVE